MAAAVAVLAACSLPRGDDIDPDTSTITISAAAADAPDTSPVPSAVTVTTALTSEAPSGKYSFW